MNGAKTETACTNKQFLEVTDFRKKKSKRAFTYQIVFFISRQNVGKVFRRKKKVFVVVGKKKTKKQVIVFSPEN